jgi:hypothetical protein
MAATPLRASASGIPDQGIAPHADALSWLPHADNLLCMAFFAPAVLLFILWNETGSRRAYIGSIILMVLASLSKEFAFILPMYAALIVFYGSKGKAEATKLKFLVPPFLLVGCVVVWRSYCLEGRTLLEIPLIGHLALATNKISQLYAYQGVTPASLRYEVMMALGDGIVVTATFCLTVFFVWKTRRESIVLLMTCFVILACVPIARVGPLPGSPHRWPFVLIWFIPLVVLLMRVALARAGSYAVQRRTALHM